MKAYFNKGTCSKTGTMIEKYDSTIEYQMCAFYSNLKQRERRH